MRTDHINIDRQEWNDQFLPIIWAFVQSYKSTKTPFLKKKLKEALKRTIYKWTDLPPRYVSTEIIRLFKEQGIDQDPFNMIYPDRNTLGRDENGKTVMLWEHTTTNHETYQSLVKCKTIEELEEVMKNHTGVCWLARHEDDLLNKSGFRSSRENGWQEAYRACGITVVEKCS